MKKLLLIILLAPLVVSAQETITWSDPIVVNANTTLGYSRPRIALTADDKPLIVWGRSSNMDVYVSRMVDTSFSSPVKITPDGVSAFIQNWVGPTLAASGDTVFVSFKSMPEESGYVYVVRSVDGGLTFGDTVRVSSENWSRFSEVSVLPNGNPVVAYMQFDHHFTDPRWVVNISTDGGMSFSTPVAGSSMAPGEACDCCPGFVLAEPGRTILMFRNNDNDLRDIWAAVSTDGSNTFPMGKDIDENNWMIGSCPSSGPDAIISGDNLVAVWMSGASGYSRVNIGSSDLATLTVGINEDISPTTTTNQNYPRIAGVGNTMGVVWQESGQGKGDINFVWSTSGAGALGSMTPIAVNPSSTGSRMNPDIAYKDGIFHLVWQDNETREVIYRSGKIETGSSVNESSRIGQLNVYPNPANEKITITLPSQAFSLQNELIIYNAAGKKVFVKQNVRSNRYEADLEGMDPGMYFIRYADAQQSLGSSFIIK